MCLNHLIFDCNVSSEPKEDHCMLRHETELLLRSKSLPESIIYNLDSTRQHKKCMQYGTNMLEI